MGVSVYVVWCESAEYCNTVGWAWESISLVKRLWQLLLPVVICLWVSVCQLRVLMGHLNTGESNVLWLVADICNWWLDMKFLDEVHVLKNFSFKSRLCCSSMYFVILFSERLTIRHYCPWCFRFLEGWGKVQILVMDMKKWRFVLPKLKHLQTLCLNPCFAQEQTTM